MRTIHALEIEQDGERIDFIIRANAFLHHMVRNIVGTLVYVGKGKHPPQWVRQVLRIQGPGEGGADLRPGRPVP